MTTPFLRVALPAALAAFAVLSPAAVRADEPPAPSPAMPEKTPAKIPDAPAAEVGVAFDRELSFDQGVAKGKADGKSVFIDFWRER